MRVLTLIALVLLCGCRTEPVGPSDPLGGRETGGDGGGSVDFAQPAPCTQQCPPADCAAVTSETACLADSACVAVTLCGNGEFQGCINPGSPVPPFGPFCYTTRCGSHTDEASCNADASCHSTYLEERDLACPPEDVDCNIGFDSCAAGTAKCVAMNAPACMDNPLAQCVGSYVPEYGDSGCIVDCVRASECPQS